MSVDPTTQKVTTQGSALWADVNRAAAQFNLAVVGGTVSQTGVGGLTLRGGYVYLTPKYGLALDNLSSVEVVIADGLVMNASADENADLFGQFEVLEPTLD